MYLLKDSKWQLLSAFFAMPVDKKLASIQVIGLSALSQLPDSGERSTNCGTNIETQRDFMVSEGGDFGELIKKAQSNLYKQATKESVLDAQRHSYCTHMKYYWSTKLHLNSGNARQNPKCCAVLEMTLETDVFWKNQCETMQKISINSTYYIYNIPDIFGACWMGSTHYGLCQILILGESTEPDKNQKPAFGGPKIQTNQRAGHTGAYMYGS